MSPRPDVSEERKQQILDAAAEVFTRRGFDEARMDDIVAETGLSKGALYWYFKSKDDIILAILDRLFQREFDRLESVVVAADEASAAERLRRFTDIVAADVAGMLRLMPIVFEFLALAFRQRVVQKALKRYVGRYFDILLPLIEQGVASGEFRPVDAGEVAVATGAIIEGTILLWAYDKSRVEPERHIRAGVRLLIDGVKARGSASKEKHTCKSST